MNDFETVRMVLRQGYDDAVPPDSLAALDRIEAEVERLNKILNPRPGFGHQGHTCKEIEAEVERLQSEYQDMARELANVRESGQAVRTALQALHDYVRPLTGPEFSLVEQARAALAEEKE